LSLKEIQQELKVNSNAEALAAAKKFVPDSKRICGVRTPVLNEMAKKYKIGGFDLVRKLWKSGAFEERHLAAKILGLISKKDPAQAIKLVGEFSSDIDNWVVCDALGMQSLKPVSKILVEETFKLSGKLANSKNLWERRLSLVLIEVYTKDKTLRHRIEERVKKLEKDPEYYVKKAVDWIKRNLAK
jgi:3-methyladenine DNA glycosylase AlkD